MKYELIYDYLKDIIGLDINSIQKQLVNAIIDRLMISNGISEINDYLNILKNSNLSSQELIEQIPISESGFFQDKYIFNFLNAEILKLKKSGKKEFKILSAGCAKGEEAYSIAIQLIENSIKPNEFQIDAIDICNSSIEFAQEGIYPMEQLSGIDKQILKKYFYEAEDLYIVNPKLSGLINFFAKNLLGIGVTDLSNKYDFIIINNVLKYLTESARKKILLNFKKILLKDAIIITTESESNLINNIDFTQTEVSFAYIFTGNSNINAERKARKKGFKDRLISIPLSFKNSKKGDNVQSNIENNEYKQFCFNRIEKLIEKGKYDTALDFCIDYKSNNSADPNGYYFIGLIYEYQNELDKAEEYFHKALYLEPYHFDTIIHLVRIFENKGWADRASMLRKRLEKITGRQ